MSEVMIRSPSLIFVELVFLKPRKSLLSLAHLYSKKNMNGDPPFFITEFILPHHLNNWIRH